MKVKLQHIFAGCNRVVHALDWGEENLIAYAAHNAVLLYDTQKSKVVAKLSGHTARVNCVLWLPAQEGQSGLGLVSGSADNSIIVWNVHVANHHVQWEATSTLQGHQGPVTGLAAHQLPIGALILVSTSADDHVIIWNSDVNSKTSPRSPNNAEESVKSAQLQDGEAEIVSGAERAAWHIQQRIALPLHIQHSIAITSLPDLPDWHLLALGGVDNTVRLLLAAPNSDFQQICKLSGHTNWVRSLAFTRTLSNAGEQLLLASASQDKYIRIWAIQEMNNSTSEKGSPNPDTSLSRYAPKPGFQAGSRVFTAQVEAMLVGHEDWVFSVAWQPQSSTSARSTLLSASMDRTMAVWRQDKATGIWMSEESVGDAGPSNLGYFGGCWSPDGNAIVANGYTGALHLWRRPDAEPSGGQAAVWEPKLATGGHFGAVVDLAWSLDGDCLLSASTDQTVRITTQSLHGDWFEVARPQIHGHDFSCLACIPPSQTGKILYASGSEEKVIRILEAPQAFLDTLASLHGQPVATFSGTRSHNDDRAFGASVPALGLSNKAVYANDAPAGADEGPDLAPRATPGALTSRPLEEHLQQSSLWPEIYKEYGHGSELFCLAADPRGQFLASACKAQSKEFAAIWIWAVGSWAPVQQLEAHTLTTIQLSFSPDGSKLVSASRDRSLAVWTRTSDEKGPFVLLGKVTKAHARVIWSVSCTPDGLLFATGGRDNLVKLWATGSPETGLPQKPLYILPTYASSVQSVAFRPSIVTKGDATMAYSLAVGLEHGGLHIVDVHASVGSPLQIEKVQQTWQAAQSEAHCGSVRRIQWRNNGNEQGSMLLASGSEDHSVHVYDIQY